MTYGIDGKSEIALWNDAEHEQINLSTIGNISYSAGKAIYENLEFKIINLAICKLDS
jgi:hypothetical protein